MTTVNRLGYFHPGDRGGFRVGIQHNPKHIKYEGTTVVKGDLPSIDVNFSAEKVKDGLRFYWSQDRVEVVLLEHNSKSYRLLADRDGDLHPLLALEKIVGPFKGFGFCINTGTAFVSHETNMTDGMSPATQVLPNGWIYSVGNYKVVMSTSFAANADVTITVEVKDARNIVLSSNEIKVARHYVPQS